MLKAMTNRSWLRIALTCLAINTVALGSGHSAGLIATGSSSGLPVPRFVSLKADRVNVRRGPDKDQEVVWVFTRPALPMEITAEFENWRRIRDWEGGEGWVYHSLLSGRRTALAIGKTKDKDELLPLYDEASVRGRMVARLQPGVLGKIKRCTGEWCRFSGDGFDGWIEQARLWGVYANEKIE